MKTPFYNNVLDQRRMTSHVIMVLFSLIIVIIFSLGRKGSAFPEFQINLFIMIMVQLELFIFLGARIFERLDLGSTRKELTRKVLSRYSLFILICFLCALIITILFMYITSLIHGSGTANVLNNFLKFEFGKWLKATLGGLLFGAAIFIFLQWQDALQREQRLKEENLIFQNETLKNQVNPHFLFNSLNTLSSLISTQPEIADDFIKRFSSIYRYILENLSRDRVPLGVELSFIKDFFFLHQIRDKEKIELEIDVKESDKFEILPVSLQILVENAIKHNKATREEPLKISIFIEDHQIVVKNNLQKMASQIKSTGIGLKNLGERVKLISGKNLVIEETSSDFIVKVPLV
jgi:two-component system, LytTR family, sensor kinase